MQFGPPFDFEFAQYRASIMDILRSPGDETRQAMEDGIESGLMPMSEQQFAAFNARRSSIDDEISTVRLKVVN